jgi:hypothetical protein
MNLYEANYGLITPRTGNRLSFAACAIVAPILSALSYGSARPGLEHTAAVVGAIIPFALWAWVAAVWSPGGLTKLPAWVQWAIVGGMVAIVVFL